MVCKHTFLCLQVVLWGRTRDELHHRIYSQQPIRGWEGQPAHVYGEVIHSSVVSLCNNYSEVKWKDVRKVLGICQIKSLLHKICAFCWPLLHIFTLVINFGKIKTWNQKCVITTTDSFFPFFTILLPVSDGKITIQHSGSFDIFPFLDFWATILAVEIGKHQLSFSNFLINEDQQWHVFLTFPFWGVVNRNGPLRRIIFIT